MTEQPDLMAALRTSIEQARARRGVRPVTSSHGDECEAEFISGAMSWSLCRCDERADNHVHDPDAPLGDDDPNHQP